MNKDIKLRKFIVATIREYLNENSRNEVELLQKELNRLENIELERARISKDYDLFDKIADEMSNVRRKLYQLTGNGYGIIEPEKSKNKTKPSGLNDKYDYPNKVPKNVYRWILSNTSLLTTDATDAVRWSRIINSKDDARYRGEITIYRAVDNHDYDEIREGDWVTTDEQYAIEHNKRYFDGNGKIISMDVNGRDVLVSPTGNSEEAIYAPLEYSIDVKL